jgi:hypothetical protein
MRQMQLWQWQRLALLAGGNLLLVLLVLLHFGVLVHLLLPPELRQLRLWQQQQPELYRS